MIPELARQTTSSTGKEDEDLVAVGVWLLLRLWVRLQVELLIQRFGVISDWTSATHGLRLRIISGPRPNRGSGLVNLDRN
jgi:hypothetical protein